MSRLAFKRAGMPAVAVVLALAVACASTAGWAASLTGKADHTFLSMKETFDYVLSLAGGDAREPPDLTPLARDFDIVDRRRQGRTDEADGKKAEVNEWVVTLAPKRPGRLTIPPLSVAGLTAPASQVEVVPALPVSQPEDLPLFVRVDAGDVAPYAQGQVPVVIRIFDSLGMRQGRLDLPTADGATLTPEGGQRTYFKTVGRQRYRVIEQSYLMQPQKSGTVDIAPVTLTATVPSRSGSSATSDMAYLLGRGPSPWSNEEVTFKSRPVPIEVKPRPAGAEGWFLPARGVTLTQQWSPALTRARVGTALTRTLRLEARGASPNQLPPLPIVEADGVRQYEDTSTSDRASVKGEAGAVLVKTISVVPTRPGRITLPAIEVGWWNTDANRQEQVVLPAQAFDVAPDGSTPPVAAQPVPVPAEAAPEPETPPAPAGGFDWRALWGRLVADRLVLAAALGAVVLLGAGVVSWRRRAAPPVAEPAPAARKPAGPPRPAPAAPRATVHGTAHGTVAAAERALEAACKANDPAAAHAALLSWTRLAATGGLSPTPFLTPEVARATQDLRHHLYGPGAGAWKGRALRSAFRIELRARRRAGKAGRASRIAPLYPTAR